MNIQIKERRSIHLNGKKRPKTFTYLPLARSLKLFGCLRDDPDLDRIRQYILYNLCHWQEDQKKTGKGYRSVGDRMTQ